MTARWLLALPLAGFALFGGAPGLEAQSGDGFLFRSPRIVVDVHGGFARPHTESEIFAFVTDQLTLSDRDFFGYAGGASIVVPVSTRFGLEASGAFMGRASRSEFRDWVDQDELPIEQSTLFARVPLIAGARAYVLPPGRRIGSFAWIPSPIAPYVGAGVGAVWYRFRQTGDFVDFEDLSVFHDELDSQGWAPAAQVSGGAEITLSPRMAITTEGQYLWATSKLGRDFVDFEPIDLSGFSATVGIAVRL